MRRHPPVQRDPPSMFQIENKGRFIVRNGIAFGVVAGVLSLCAMRFLGTQISYSAPLVLSVLVLWILGGLAWALMMWRFLQRSRRQNQAFYSQLRGEMTNPESTSIAPAPEVTGGQRCVSVVITKSTLWENLALALIILYGTPSRVARTIAVPVLIGAASTALPVDANFTFIPMLLKFLGFTVAFSCFFTGLIALSIHRVLRRIWQGHASATITFTPAAVEMTQGGSSPVGISWNSIDSIREAGGYFVFVRGKRFLFAIPRDRVGEDDLSELRRLLRAAKGKHAYLRV